MQTLENGYRAFGLLMTLNWDRALYVVTIAVALTLGAWIGSL